MAKKTNDVPKSVADAFDEKQTYNPLIAALQENDKKNLFKTNVITAYHKTGYPQFDHYFGSVMNVHDDLGKIISQKPRLGQAAGTFNMFVGNSQSGKAEPLSTMIPAPVKDGYIKMGDITLGTKLFGHDGSIITVDGIHDRGIKDVYRITFEDGRTNVCAGDHLWQVNCISFGAMRENVVSTIDMLKDYKNFDEEDGTRKYYIPALSSAAKYPTQEVPFDPYTLGIILSVQPEKTENDIFKLVLDNEYIAQTIALNNGWSYTYDYVSGPLRLYYFYHEDRSYVAYDEVMDRVRAIACHTNLNYDEYFIPYVYRYNDEQTRLALLQGLMDMGARISRTEIGTYIEHDFDQHSLVAKGAQEIIWSLGYSATILDGHNLMIYTEPKFLREIFSLASKQDMIPYEDWGNRYLAVVEIEKIGQEHCKCIHVNTVKHLYLTNQFIVTHNTTWTSQIGANIIKPHKYSTLIHFDCEERFDITRAENITHLPADYFKNNRYMIKTGAVGLDTIQEMVVKLYVSKMKLYDQLLTETEDFDEFNNRIKILQPTVILIDSITTVLSETFNPENSKEASDAEKMRSNTEGARDAKTLKGFFKDILPLCKEANIIVYSINHININMSMNAFTPVAKQQNYLKQDESIPGGKTMLYYPFNIVKLTAKTSDNFDEDTDGFNGHIVMVEPLKSSSNQSGNNSKGISFDMVFDQKRGFDSIRSLILYGRDHGIIEGNRNRLKFKDNDSFTFTWKDLNTEMKEKPIMDCIKKYIIPDLDQYLPYTKIDDAQSTVDLLSY